MYVRTVGPLIIERTRMEKRVSMGTSASRRSVFGPNEIYMYVYTYADL